MAENLNLSLKFECVDRESKSHNLNVDLGEIDKLTNKIILDNIKLFQTQINDLMTTFVVQEKDDLKKTSKKPEDEYDEDEDEDDEDEEQEEEKDKNINNKESDDSTVEKKKLKTN